MDELVEVTQADEERVAEIEWFVDGGFSESERAHMARAFARHRIAAAPTAWSQRTVADDEWRPTGNPKIGDRVTKIKGSSWTGRIVGYYSTSLTPVGYCVESENEPGSVQIYPASALRHAVTASHATQGDA